MDDLIANRKRRGERTIEPSIGSDLPRRSVVGMTAELYSEGEALWFEPSRESQCGGMPGARANHFLP